MGRYKPVGWRFESYRHYLAAKGIKTRMREFRSRQSVVLPKPVGDLEDVPRFSSGLDAGEVRKALVRSGELDENDRLKSLINSKTEDRGVEKRYTVEVTSLTPEERIRESVAMRKEIPGTGKTRAAAFQQFGRHGLSREAIGILEKYDVEVPSWQKAALFAAEELGGEKAVRVQLRPIIYALRQREVAHTGGNIIRKLPETKKGFKDEFIAGERFFKYQRALKELERL